MATSGGGGKAKGRARGKGTSSNIISKSLIDAINVVETLDIPEPLCDLAPGGEQRFHCTFAAAAGGNGARCNKVCSRKADYKKHYRTHLSVRPHVAERFMTPNQPVCKREAS